MTQLIQHGVIFGGVVSQHTSPNYSVDFTDGAILYQASPFADPLPLSFNGGTLAIATPDPLYDRVDVVAVDATGTVYVITGTAGAIVAQVDGPYMLEVPATTDVTLAEVGVLAAATAITDFSATGVALILDTRQAVVSVPLSAADLILAGKIGYPARGSSYDTNLTDVLLTNGPYTAPVAGTAQSVTIDIGGGGGGSGSQKIRCAIFGDSSGSPHSLLGVSAEQTIAYNADRTLVTFPIASPFGFAMNDLLYPAIWFGTSTSDAHYWGDDGAPSGISQAMTTATYHSATNPPNPDVPTITGHRQATIYINYT